MSSTTLTRNIVKIARSQKAQSPEYLLDPRNNRYWHIDTPVGRKLQSQSTGQSLSPRPKLVSRDQKANSPDYVYDTRNNRYWHVDTPVGRRLQSQGSGQVSVSPPQIKSSPIFNLKRTKAHDMVRDTTKLAYLGDNLTGAGLQISTMMWNVERHPPWMTDEEFTELKVFVNSTDFSQYEHDQTLDFAKHKLIVLVYTSNKLEGTIPKGCSEHETYALLRRLLDNSDSAYPEEKHWKADGDNVGPAASAQMQQHLLAAQYLMSQARPIDVGMICDTHKILMANALDEQGVAVPAGTFRRIPVHAGQHAFPDWTTIPTSIDKLLDEVNTLMEGDVTHAVSIAARLFYKLVCIHPFQDGNGRLCRLLVAWVLCRKAAVPFPVTMSSGKSKSRKHYINAILHGHRGYGLDHLEALVAWSLWHDWQNLQVNMSLL